MKMGAPTSWLFGDAPDGRLLGTLTFGQLFGVRLGFWLSRRRFIRVVRGVRVVRGAL